MIMEHRLLNRILKFKIKGLILQPLVTLPKGALNKMLKKKLRWNAIFVPNIMKGYSLEN